MDIDTRAKKVKGFALLTAFIFFCFFSTVAAQNTADYFIAQDPAAFEILNRYQQKIDPAAKSTFRQFTPWKIIDENALLSDQYTKSLHAELRGRSYFFIKNEQEELLNSAPAGYHQIFYNCTPVNDTIIVMRNRAVIFKRIPIDEKDNNFKSSYLEQNIHVIRLFKYNKDYFVERLGADPEYGWLRILNEKGIEEKKIELSQQLFDNSEFILEQIREKINRVNVLYSQLFTYMNTSLGQKKEIPQWEMQETENGIIFSLSEPQFSENLKNSTSYLLSDLQLILKSSPFTLSSGRDSFEINKLTENSIDGF